MRGQRKLPIGVQNFERLRRDGFLYVDKTAYIYQLSQSGMPYFLSRPRRFGKSLLLSTMRAFWEGKRELFTGLEIERQMEESGTAWEAYPVFYFDFNKDDLSRMGALEDVLDRHLRDWEKDCGILDAAGSLAGRFQSLLVAAKERTGKNAVVLVDEYDKPLLEGMSDEALIEHNNAVFQGFFSTLKSYDGYLKFVFLTRVTRFSKVSIFSDLNQLNDISMDAEYAGICGLTEAEIRGSFAPELAALAEARGTTEEACLAELKRMYDGYHFAPDTEGVYNPFSLFNALSKKKLGAYWFATGTPGFLLEKLSAIDFDARRFTSGELYADEAALNDYRVESADPLPLFYQTGYLTIKDYDEETASCGLGYPNDEVKYGFLKSLAPSYLHQEREDSPLDVRSFGRDILNGDTESLRERFGAIFARLPYAADDKPLERDFQNVVYIVFMLLGQFVHTEVHSAKGRADVIVETDRYVYLFEFKRDASAREALAQIEEKGYAAPYAVDARTVLMIGVNFDSGTRALDGWEMRQAGETGR